MAKDVVATNLLKKIPLKELLDEFVFSSEGQRVSKFY